MSKANESLEGRCRCGQVRFTVSSPPLLTMACHCTGCQRMTGSAFSLSAAIPSNGFSVAQGEPVTGGLHGALPHFFCPYCMSWLFTRPPGYDFVTVRTTMFDDPSRFIPFIETYTSEKLPWAKTPAPRSFEKFPALEDYKSLLEEYAQWGKEPAARERDASRTRR